MFLMCFYIGSTRRLKNFPKTGPQLKVSSDRLEKLGWIALFHIVKRLLLNKDSNNYVCIY